MSDTLEAGRCLNCGAPLQGPFCALCGQRSVPANPTVRELAGDAWQELSGYDGRIMATLRGLLRPGFLTREYLAGRRAHYLPPLRLYLIVSVAYFVIAAGAPAVGRSQGTISGPGGVRVGITNDERTGDITDEERAELLREAETAHWLIRPMLRDFATDPDGWRARIFTVMPRVFFALLPVFAAVVALFYGRRRHFPTFLVFAVHLHAFAFVVFSMSEALKYVGPDQLAESVGAVLALGFALYALKSFRAVFGGGWPVTIAKAVGIGLVYMVASMPAFVILMLWVSWM
ncbi:MAG TPA: DUF3667 domain-containing protein [Vicinamibacterales bacterium]|nr:DUF3667 domain-containing protein [Vicinamibacterales bacterium]